MADRIVPFDLGQTLQEKIYQCHEQLDIAMTALRREPAKGVNDTRQRLAMIFLQVGSVAFEAAQLLQQLDQSEGGGFPNGEQFSQHMGDMFLGTPPQKE